MTVFEPMSEWFGLHFKIVGPTNYLSVLKCDAFIEEKVCTLPSDTAL